MKRLAQNRPALVAAIVAIVALVGGIAIFSSRAPTTASGVDIAAPSTPPTLRTGTTMAESASTAIGARGGTTATDVPVSPVTPPSALAPNPPITPPGPTVVVPPGDTPITVPAQVNVSGNNGARDGTPVVVRVQADAGSKLYGIEARLCRAGATFTFDADFLPTAAGNCIARPLSSGSDAKVEVPVPAPNQSGELTFRVGVGTDAFNDREGALVNITCGPGNPCQVVVKVQYPNGFGFKTYPVTYG